MSREVSVLYDAPGPKAKRRTVIVSIGLALLTAGALYLFVYRPLAAKGQFSMVKWGTLIDPSNEYFGNIWGQLQLGIIATLKAAALAIICSLVLGTLLALLRLQLQSLSHRRYRGLPSAVAFFLRGLTWVLSVLTRICVEVFRGIPVIITIYFAYILTRSYPVWPLTLFRGDLIWPLVIGLTIYNGIVIAEIVRSGMEGLTRGQREAGESIGLSPGQTTRLVLLPQAVRIMLPAIISQIVVILKDTALGFLIGYEELLATGRRLTQSLPTETFDFNYYNPIQMMAVIGTMFIIVNYGLSKLAQYTERKLSVRSAGKRNLNKQAQLSEYGTGRDNSIVPGVIP